MRRPHSRVTTTVNPTLCGRSRSTRLPSVPAVARLIFVGLFRSSTSGSLRALRRSQSTGLGSVPAITCLLFVGFFDPQHLDRLENLLAGPLRIVAEARQLTHPTVQV